MIEIRIREISQLFNSLDPSPFQERDLGDDAEAYIVGWARELPAGAALRLVVHLPESEANKAEERGLATCLNNYFGQRAEILDRDLRELFRYGRLYLSIGVTVLIICLIAGNLVRASLGTGPIARALQEGLTILGWVANWKPLETFLYDWWPVKRRRDLYQRLRDATVEIEFH